MSYLRRQRRAIYDKMVKDLQVKERQRELLADSFLEGIDITEEMIMALDKGVYHDKDFQKKWNKFQDLQKQIEFLRGETRKLASFRNANLATGGQAAKELQEEQKKNQKPSL